ncbi:hypothetical protein VTK73DRAFT_335 [Phialemonium thermophilum]|uniref:Btz domain-containing protein n=1 Tax=Phialemonium thermophilum TaxID=223376 RepID=A0ABR3XFJ0_9PEZI
MPSTATGPPRRKKFVVHRRRVEDEGEDDTGLDAVELDDDSLTEGSMASDDNDAAHDSDTSNIDEASPTGPNHGKSAGNGTLKGSQSRRQEKGPAASTREVKPEHAALTETEIMLGGLSLSDQPGPPPQEISFDDVQQDSAASPQANQQSANAAPVIVSSASAPQPQPRVPLQERRRREHEEYRRKRDEDPAFVPNRGAFFMHDHRHGGPAANGFRPFGRGGRGGGAGRGRGGFGSGFYAPVQQFQNPSDPTTASQWTHDMHEVVANPYPPRQTRRAPDPEGPPNGNGYIPTCPPNPTPINRTMSTEKLLGNVQIRVFFPPLKSPIVFSGVPVKQYTKLPDHRPPLRRDKPVRISLPGFPPRYIFPAMDRSFIFIPRAMRPNQQRARGKGPRSTLGSIGGFSRRTSVFGGSFYGSAYSPSVALSRRSSLAPDLGREFLASPAGSVMSRPPIPIDSARPVVRLPPHPQAGQPSAVPFPAPSASAAGHGPDLGTSGTATKPPAASETSITDLPQPQTHPLPQKPPAYQENLPAAIPMHQPRPQKTVSVENIESPAQSLHNASQPFQQAFHQQYPVPAPNGFLHESHNRNPSYPSQVSTGTPLSQIPERAIHAAPFQPNTYPPQQQHGFYGQPYQMMQPQQGYYYPPAYGGSSMAPNPNAPPFTTAQQQGQTTGYGQANQGDSPAAQTGVQPAPNLVAQEVNGMVYYYDTSQLPAVTAYPSYPPAQGYAPGVVGGGIVTPSPDAFYYSQAPPAGVVYYPQ